MPIGDIIGGATSTRSDESDSDNDSGNGNPLSQAADDAGATIREYLNERTPEGVEWTLNFGFIATALSAASAVISLYRALA